MERKRFRKTASPHGAASRLVVCAAVILLAAVIKLCFGGTQLHRDVSAAVHGDMDIRAAVEALGRAVGGEAEIISVFKEILQPPAESVSAQETEPAEEAASGDNAEVQRLRQLQNTAELERLSFEMSAAELSDDTKAESFVIPPPSYCSYEKAAIPFKYTPPVYGVVTSPFGYRDHPVGGEAGFHSGMDIAAAQGTKVQAFADGTVLQASTNRVYGKFVLIEHEGGIRSFYGHNSRLCVKDGERVRMGQKIAEVGSTGLSTGPHVHFEVRRGNIRLNPRHYISPDRI